MTDTTLSIYPTLVERRADGAIILQSAQALPAYPESAAANIARWAEQDPDRLALADRFGVDGAWRKITFGQIWREAGRLGQGLLEAGVTAERPVLLAAQNSIETATVMLACMRAGVPSAPITPAYSDGSGDPKRLGIIAETLRPSMVIVDNGERHKRALEAALGPDVRRVAFAGGGDFTALADLGREPGELLAGAEAAVTGDTAAKILFTSGSTGTPKGAINSHRMLASNFAGHSLGWPFLAEEPPVLVDWLPWSHTFGGNFVLYTMMASGGSFYIDDGRPTPDAVRRSVENIAEVGPTIHVNVPRGLDLVSRVLLADPELADRFFARLRLVFFASSGIPPRVAADWQTLIERHARREVVFVSAWGLTETAPTSTVLNFPSPFINNIGTPIPGSQIKLAPMSERLELRVKGPNVTPGYLNRPDLTAAAFDEDGFFKTGDAAILANEDAPEDGLLIQGRFAEDFKLASGVWVNVGGLRAKLLEALGPAVRDVVFSGPHRDELGLLIFLDLEQSQRVVGVQGDLAELARSEAVQHHLAEAIGAYNTNNTTNSRRIAHWHVLPRAPDPTTGEITEKGTVNQGAVLKREQQTCEAMHALSTV